MGKKIIIDENGFLTNDEKTNGLNYNLRGRNFCIINSEILTFHKNDFFLIKIKELGDKMYVFKFVGRPEIIFKNIDKTAFIMGMSIFQEFDENNGNFNTYLYKFNKSEVEDLNEILKVYGIQDSEAKIKGNFVILDTNIILTKNIFEQLDNWINENNYNEILSFIFGMSLIYGKIHVDENDIKSVKLHIPLIGGLALYKEKFDYLIDYLWKIGIPSRKNILEKNIGLTYQVAFTDWELLNIFANYLKPIIQIKRVVKYEQIISLKNMLKYHITSDYQIENAKDIIKMIDKGIIKILVK